ncbi:MAG: hypothetical protein AAFR16_01730 [Pseudomonadota bacterium]
MEFSDAEASSSHAESIMASGPDIVDPEPDRRADIDQYVHIRSFERDYDTAQGEMRRACSIWLIAIITGLGSASYSIDFGSASGGAPPPMTVFAAWVLIAFVGALGVFLLWWIDQVTYQTLLHAMFVHGLYIEWLKRDDPTWPRYRSALYAQNLNIHWKLNFFYFAPGGLMLLVVYSGMIQYVSCFFEPDSATCVRALFGTGGTVEFLFLSWLPPLLIFGIAVAVALVTVVMYRTDTGRPLNETFGRKLYGEEFARLATRDTFAGLARDTFSHLRKTSSGGSEQD